MERLSAALPADERAAFGYDARSLDWWDYWINVHIPALRKWCYPLIEGRRRKTPAAQCPARISRTAAGRGLTARFPATN